MLLEKLFNSDRILLRNEYMGKNDIKYDYSKHNEQIAGWGFDHIRLAIYDGKVVNKNAKGFGH